MFESFDAALIRWNKRVLMAILAAMSVMVFANVVLRFLTDESIEWVEELSRYLMIWLTFLGAGIVLRYGGHIGIDNLQESLPTHAKKVRLAIFIFLLAFFVFMFYVGIRYSLFTWEQTTPVMGIPMGVVYLAMPIGSALLIVHLLIMARPYLAEKIYLADAEFDSEAAKL
jgi:TRAP-type C4-dicarboxylate transport system permease small subunit